MNSERAVLTTCVLVVVAVAGAFLFSWGVERVPPAPANAEGGSVARTRAGASPLDQARAAPRTPGFRLESLRVGEPLPRILETPGGRRFVSVMVVDDPPPNPTNMGEGEPVEPSDLDDDHPGAYWSDAGFASLRAVADALGLNPAAAWVDSPSGELLLTVPDPSGAPRLVSVSPDAVPGDLDGDGRADIADLVRYLSWFGDRKPWADMDDNGRLDGDDVRAYLSAWSSARR